LEVIVTGKAAHDLDEWLSRIEADNPAAAEAFQARIRHWIEVIRQHPQAGHRHPKRREIRTVVESPIIIYYTVSASQNRNPSILAFSQKSKINSLSLAAAEHLEDSAFLIVDLKRREISLQSYEVPALPVALVVVHGPSGPSRKSGCSRL
jgi:plasmid stabilization system protein ParE